METVQADDSTAGGRHHLAACQIISGATYNTAQLTSGAAYTLVCRGSRIALPDGRGDAEENESEEKEKEKKSTTDQHCDITTRTLDAGRVFRHLGD